MRYKLRTLLILLAVLPPLMWIGWGKYQAWKAEQERQRILNELAARRLAAKLGEYLIGTPQPFAPSYPPAGPPPASSDLEHGKGPRTKLAYP